MFCISRIFPIILLLALAACAPRLMKPLPSPPPVSEAREFETVAEKSWWACRFKIAWPPDAAPDMTVDLLLAQAVVGPILKTEGQNLLFWRFHRRAAPDDSGHQFSFLFYSDTQTLKDITEAIRQNKTVHQALESRIVEQAACDADDSPRRPEISAMSDAKWSPALQKHWPFFIMGVSRLWLGLINEALSGLPPHADDFSKRLEQIREVETKINAVWYREGQHAFFHHLSAVFGYEPLLIRKEIRF